MSGIVISGDTRGGVGGPQRKPGAAAPAAGAYKAAVGGVLAKLQAAWNKGDAKGVGALFGKEADYVNMTGAHISGADKITEAHTALFGASKSQAAYRVLKLKPLSPDLVMAYLGQKITVTADGKEQAMATRPTILLRKVGADWKIVAMQVTRFAGAARGGGGGGASGKKDAAKAAPAKAADKKADKK